MLADAVHMLDQQVQALLDLCPDTHTTTQAAYHFGQAIGILRNYVGDRAPTQPPGVSHTVWDGGCSPVPDSSANDSS
jgi:hypothetical protein